MDSLFDNRPARKRRAFWVTPFVKFLHACSAKMDRTRSAIGIAMGLVATVGSLVVAWVVVSSGEKSAIETLSSSGVADPKRLSDSISTALYGYAIGLFGTVIGLVILIISALFYVRAGRRLRAAEAGSVAPSGDR
jgi:hypothetical protein